ncbi:MAG: hypothetical protein CFE43_02545 [Burkholderiales bacterium PBB3]|nr:MAG: hypothetical protein CFE43_02545 [Burkholderiales bacterium PBB3]
MPHAQSLLRRISWVSVLLLAACSSAPIAPIWQGEAKDALDRANAAYLEGDSRVALAEMTRVRRAISGTGRADWLANAELAHCAAQVASLVLEPCHAFEALRADATAAQIAYADYLRAQIKPGTPAATLALLPAVQQGIASQPNADAAALKSLADPLSRLVGAAVWLQKGQASPAVIEVALETSSHQGWRRPLLAWLGVQAQRAEQAGNTAELERLRRRMALVEGRSEGRSRATP